MSDPAERLLRRYDFKIERPARTFEQDVAASVFGRARPAPGEAVLADPSGSTIHVDDIRHFEGAMRYYDTAGEAARSTEEDFKAFLLESKKLGHDTFFERHPWELAQTRKFSPGPEQIIWKAYIRGSTWKAAK